MSAAELLQSHFRTLKVDPDAWHALFASDAVMELPFTPPPGPRVLKGIEEIKQFSGALEQLGDDFKITQKNVYQIQGEDAVFAEFSMRATVKPTGKIYDQDYVLYLRAENGKIVFYREYFDAPRVTAAFTPHS
ncbi:NTF2-like protein [Trichoderma chlorosporum]